MKDYEDDVKIYILTHKQISENYDSKLYFPLLNGSALLDDDFGYIRDDSGENISNLNSYYAELTGQYWAWKNSDAEIIGFCHYRRWFVRNLKFDKLTRKDIISYLNEYDIILSPKFKLSDSLKDTIIKGLEDRPDYGAKWEDYVKLGEILKNKFPDYYNVYMDIMNGKECYSGNMFICYKKIANQYFSWLFQVLDELKGEINFENYPENNKRVLGFFSETLLMVFCYKHNIKIKQQYIVMNERKFPYLTIINSKFPFIQKIERKIFNLRSNK